MADLFFYRIPKINNFTEDAVPAILEDIERRKPAGLVQFIASNHIQDLAPEITFSEQEMRGAYDRHHSLLLTFMLAILDRSDTAPSVAVDWSHELIIQLEERKVHNMSDEQQDICYELLLQIDYDWGNLVGPDTEPFEFPGYLNKTNVIDLLSILESVTFQRADYQTGTNELIAALRMAAQQSRELVLERQL